MTHVIELKGDSIDIRGTLEPITSVLLECQNRFQTQCAKISTLDRFETYDVGEISAMLLCSLLVH